MVTKKEIIDKLSMVNDPELGINIVDLGLIYEIKTEMGIAEKKERQKGKKEAKEKNGGEGDAGGTDRGKDRENKKKNEMQKIYIKMTFTTPACPLINDILNEVKTRLDEFKEADIEITVVFDPPWTTDRMTERAKIKLGMI